MEKLSFAFKKCKSNRARQIITDKTAMIEKCIS